MWIDKQDFIKLRVSVKKTINKRKRQSIEWEKILCQLYLIRELISKIFKELRILNIESYTINKQANELKRHSPREQMLITNKHTEIVQYPLPSGKIDKTHWDFIWLQSEWLSFRDKWQQTLGTVRDTYSLLTDMWARAATVGSLWRVLNRLKQGCPLSRSTPGSTPKEGKSTETSHITPTASLFTTGKAESA